MEEGNERDEATRLLANHKQKQMLAVNADGVEDAKIFKDLAEMSHGALRPDPQKMRLHEFREQVQPAGKKKKKKNQSLL